ncbi:cellulase family glycosylhydrolase [Serratia proteamaculans]|uniref:cellulase family glycosylhydrolase n=1 Tax=Serratia proteamaculans TaxID=28151 RepID=UPI0014795E47|nr:cellulase family glycosylhydrolase [Serratia proteamaculans]CAI0895505.1 Beta-xylosidase [Serratia proteamaculans]CAI0956102.1 Beta-xylosidase [Serratia proteamaculans]CAI0960086.1 Beta-xylosidase [Serratia proteamaculans]CAI2087391.1 Beta-xylosidase [Serratia proteamaculans]
MKTIRKMLFSIALFGFYSVKCYSFELGVGTHLAFYPNSDDYYIQLAKSYGFTSLRDEVSWQQIEKTPKVYSIPKIIDKTDSAFSSIKSDVSMILILSYGNVLYTQGGYPQNDDDIQKFSDYSSWVVERYKGRVKYYEIWNEWLVGTGVSNKKIKRPGDDVFLSLVKSASYAIKKVDNEAVVMTGTINPLKPQERKWIYSLVGNGLLKYVDAISIHPYSFQFKGSSLQTPEGNLIEVDKFEEELKKIEGKEIPLYITEVGYPTIYAGGGFSPEKAGVDTLKYSLLAKARSYIRGIWWYDFIDDGKSFFNREHHFGLLDIDQKPKPSALYLKEFRNLIKYSNVKIIRQSVNGIVEVNISSRSKSITIQWDNSKSDSDLVFIEQLRLAKKELNY